MTTETSLSARLASDVGDRLTRGVAAGLFGGFAFIFANMVYADVHGKPAVAPFLSISTIYRVTDTPMMSPQNVIIGVIVHTSLSMVFGAVFGLLVVPLLRSTALLVGGAVVYGLLLFVVNIEILGRIFFPWFTNPMGPNQLFELWIHPVGYGLFLVPFFLGMRGREAARETRSTAPLT